MTRRGKGSQRGPCDPRARPGRAPERARTRSPPSNGLPKTQEDPGPVLRGRAAPPRPSLPTPINEPPGRCHEGARAAGLGGDRPEGGGLRGAAAPQPRDSRGKREPGIGQETRLAVLGRGRRPRGRGEAEPGPADWTRGRAAVTWVMESPKSRTRGQTRGLPLATASHSAMMPTAGRRGHAGYPGGADSGGAGPGWTPGRGELPGMGRAGGGGACAVRSLR